MPKIFSGLTALLLWIIAHFIFIVGAIAAFAFPLAVERFRKYDYNVVDEVEKIKERHFRYWDSFLIATFPILYLIFNIVYWTHYS